MIMAQTTYLEIPGHGLIPASSFISYDAVRCRGPVAQGTADSRIRLVFGAVVSSHAGQSQCSIPSKLDY